MLRYLCLLLLTIFFIFKATDVLTMLLAKEKVTAVCNSDDCENEKSEVEKINDDQTLHQPFVNLYHYPQVVILRVAFSYSISFENELFKNLFSPPPELV